MPLHPHLGALIRAERIARDWTQHDVGERLGGLSRQSVGAWEKAQAWPEPDKLNQLASLFGWGSIGFLNDGTVQISNTRLQVLPDGVTISSRRTSVPDKVEGDAKMVGMPVVEPARLPWDIPVLRTEMAPSGAGFLLGDEAVDYVRRPPGIASAAGIFAVYAVGTSMIPRFKPGELLYITSARQPSIGSDILIELEAGHAMLRELVAWRSTSIVCRQYQPDAEADVPLAHIKRIWRILTLNELYG